ncbi:MULTISPECIES: VOC family protein [Exiguobacterium]|uniref:Glyoxalase/Bleomycin resistance protein/Dioxygenase superfamily n=1 Tax=Exiguobacterium aurantiacum TaxID=33987 RepID=A0A377FQB1_9BACL|nr:MULTISPECIES: VOC family protein [Exiguobacterium]STO07019.1 Glyoxalase/Bleomycin resistance protein/Dioxygenase superfamily [Exiguobacterium aurantiacum]
MGIKLDMVGIVVEDMKRALDFYRLLGLAIPEAMDGEAHVEVDDGGVRLAFDTVEVAESVYGEWKQATGHRVELAFLCDSRDELDARYEAIVGHGYASHREPWDAFWGQRYAIVIDPDGNLISLFAA